MHLANSTTAAIKKTALFICIIFSYTFASAQENSPYSRYGMGDIVPAGNMVSRSMGGISTAFVDSSTLLPYQNSQSINLSNPASLGSLNVLGNTALFDLGGEVDVRTLKSNNSPDKYKATNTLISYLQLAFPITPKRMVKKGYNWGVAFGLRPLTRINYKIEANKRLTNIDSVSTLYEGTGGINQANFSTGIKYKNFSFGVSTGYSFGNRDINTKLRFISDTVNYQFSNTDAETTFGGLFLTLGTQYSIHLKDKSVLRIGATANLQQNLKAKRNSLNETFTYGSDGSIISIDTVTFAKEEAGTIKLPSSYSVGFTYNNSHWVIGADINFASWSQYSFYGTKDAVKNSTTFHAGAQYYPATKYTPIKAYWKFVKYRAGFYYGSDYINLANSSKPDYGVSLGAGIPLTLIRTIGGGGFVTLNTGVELGQRGNKTNQSLRENIFRVNIGISMSGSWFQKRKYD
jgi:hypothetical protein